VATKYFEQPGEGRLVGISSISALRGNRHATSYAASKVYISNYLEGLNQRFVHARLPIVATDVQHVATIPATVLGTYLGESRRKTPPSGLYHSPVGIGRLALQKNASVVVLANVIPVFAPRPRQGQCAT
jgi:hypothetical protein